jgi:hypothetical protein
VVRVPNHPRRLAQQDRQRHVDRPPPEAHLVDAPWDIGDGDRFVAECVE